MAKRYRNPKSTSNGVLDELLETIIEDDEVEEESYPYPSLKLLQDYRDDKNRVINIISDVTEELLDKEAQIIRWNKEDEKNGVPVEDRKPITIRLYTYGGDANACLSFIDVMKLSKTPIKMVCMGIAMSAGALIFVSAPKGSRYITKHATILFHEGSGGTSGTAGQVLDQAENYKKFLDQMKKIVLENTEIPDSTYAKKCKKEWYIYAEDAIKYGIADHVLENIEDLI